jgi:hypothetical protein
MVTLRRLLSIASGFLEEGAGEPARTRPLTSNLKLVALAQGLTVKSPVFST